MDTILRSDVMKAILTGQPFDLDFVTCDRRRGTGGQLITVKKWRKMKEDLPEDIMPGKKRFIRRKESDNYRHKTFTIFNPANRKQHPVTVHFRLMDVFNGKKITNG